MKNHADAMIFHRGIFNVPVELDGQFKQMLVDYYESGNMDPLKEWIADRCIDGTTRVVKERKSSTC